MTSDPYPQDWEYPYLTKLLSGIRGDPGELEMVDVVHRRVTVVWKDGCNLRSVPVVGTRILRVLKTGTFYETTKEEFFDGDKNRWIELPEGFVCTFYYGTLRVQVEIIPSS
mgnify:FL=1